MKKQIFITIFLLTSLFTVHSMDIDLGSTQSVDSDYSFYDTTINFVVNNESIDLYRKSRDLKRSHPEYRIFKNFLQPAIVFMATGAGVPFALGLAIISFTPAIGILIPVIIISVITGAYGIPATIAGAVLFYHARQHYLLYKQSVADSSQSEVAPSVEMSYGLSLY